MKRTINKLGMGGLSQLGKKTYYKILIVDIVLNSEKLNMSL